MKNYDLTVHNPAKKLSQHQTDKLVNFLHNHLDEYGDSRPAITKCIQYAMQETDSPGGFALQLFDGEDIIGAVVVNRTGMERYIPENILVYIAMHEGYRGQGLGKRLMEAAIENAEGDIALHVEPDNPAKFLYEKLGFENKYLEMRLKKDS